MKTLHIKSFAKVNLGLRVLEKREDGYHNINTIMQTVSIFDELDISLTEKGITLKNTKEKFGVRINLKKNIPIGGGLGGGSSDAASVLVGLKFLLSSSIGKGNLKEMALSIGSDVVFFIDGGTAFVSGRGEVVKPICPEPFFNYLLVFPNFGVNTKYAYDKINFLTKKEKYIRISDCNFDNGGLKKLKMLVKNDFEEVMFRKYKELKTIKQFLIQNGAISVSLSGSGSTVYGIFDDIEKMDSSLELLKRKRYWVKKAFSIPSSEIPQFSFKE
ncbi:MAG: 4-(cytidine 5'-diphospho)-2-C-methyl-D-erythritol kinase [Candidatus Cloacimonas sp. 4484_209]|nr:MAG: 4-(cytidine 5'-diphospho)-2-C-methyl-D-erythritol kinase [Candidatus Cloacimonas sp. 4484_209]